MTHCRWLPVLGLLLCLSFLPPAYAQSGGPADARALYAEGLSAQVQRNYTRAVEFYRASLRVNPNYLEALVGLAESFFALEEYDESLIYLERAKRFASQRLDLMILEGRIHLSLNDLDRAQNQFMLVLGLEKNNIEAQFGLAELDIAWGRTQNAVLRYQETLKIQPRNKKALLSLSLLSESQGANDAAESYLEQALKLHSSDPQVHFTAGRFALNKEDLEHALVYLRTAISLDPDFSAAKQLLAQTYLLDGQGGKAVQFLREMLDIERNDPLAWYTIGLSYEQLGETERAIHSLAQTLRLSPDDEIARIALENIALDKLPIGDAGRTQYAGYHLERGRLFEQRNFLEKAMLEYRRSLRLDPESKQCRLAYAGIFNTLGFPIKFQKELEVLRNLGYTDTEIVDYIEIIKNETYDSVAADWGVDQYALEKNKFLLSVYHLPGSRQIHPNAGVILTDYFKDLLYRYENIEIVDEGTQSSSFESAFRQARAGGSDYFLILRFEEFDRSFTVNLEQYLSRTGTLLKKYHVFRTGNERILDTFVTLTRQFQQQLPIRGRLLKRQFDRGLVDLGLFDGIEPDQEFIVVKQGKVTLKNDRIGFFVEDEDILGTISILKLDENLAEGKIIKLSFFDLINPGDEIIEPLPKEEKQEPEEPNQGLLRRLLSLIGL